MPGPEERTHSTRWLDTFGAGAVVGGPGGEPEAELPVGIVCPCSRIDDQGDSSEPEREVESVQMPVSCGREIA
jgi:hypothetical protein